MIDGHKPNHTCLACGAEYWACDSCDKKISKTWRVACCTEGHYKAYYAMWQYGQGQIPIEEARAVLVEQGADQWDKAPGKQLIQEILNSGAEPEPEADEEAQAKTNFNYGKQKKQR